MNKSKLNPSLISDLLDSYYATYGQTPEDKRIKAFPEILGRCQYYSTYAQKKKRLFLWDRFNLNYIKYITLLLGTYEDLREKPDGGETLLFMMIFHNEEKENLEKKKNIEIQRFHRKIDTVLSMIQEDYKDWLFTNLTRIEIPSGYKQLLKFRKKHFNIPTKPTPIDPYSNLSYDIDLATSFDIYLNMQDPFIASIIEMTQQGALTGDKTKIQIIKNHWNHMQRVFHITSTIWDDIAFGLCIRPVTTSFLRKFIDLHFNAICRSYLLLTDLTSIWANEGIIDFPMEYVSSLNGMTGNFLNMLQIFFLGE